MRELSKMLAGSRGAVIVARRLTQEEVEEVESRRVDCDAAVHAGIIATEEERFRRPGRGGKHTRGRGMPISDDAALRGFVERLLGWSNERAVELAHRSVELAANHRAALVLCGTGDMVPIARALHRRAFGAERPFVVCDPRRGNTPASVRSPANRTSGLAALQVAAGGSLCMRARRVPRDFPALDAQLQATDDVLFIVCTKPDDAIPLLVRPAPIHVPPLAGRAAELDQVIAEYAADAIAELGAPPGAFTKRAHAWVRQHATTSLAEVAKATLRLVALRTSRKAAARLGMAPVSLSRWVDRRGLRRVLAADGRSPCRPT
jgi:hypothetical protein